MDFNAWLTALKAMFDNWQVTVPALLAVAALVYVLVRYAVHKPKIVALVKILLESSQGWLSAVLGPKFGPVYNALMAAVEAVIDGNFTKDEAVSVAKESFADALKMANITLTTEEQAAVDKVIELVVNAVMKDKPAVKALFVTK